MRNSLEVNELINSIYVNQRCREDRLEILKNEFIEKLKKLYKSRQNYEIQEYLRIYEKINLKYLKKSEKVQNRYNKKIFKLQKDLFLLSPDMFKLELYKSNFGNLSQAHDAYVQACLEKSKSDRILL